LSHGTGRKSPVGDPGRSVSALRRRVRTGLSHRLTGPWYERGRFPTCSLILLAGRLPIRSGHEDGGTEPGGPSTSEKAADPDDPSPLPPESQAIGVPHRSSARLAGTFWPPGKRNAQRGSSEPPSPARSPKREISSGSPPASSDTGHVERKRLNVGFPSPVLRTRRRPENGRSFRVVARLPTRFT